MQAIQDWQAKGRQMLVMNEKTIVLTLEILFILAVCLLISSFRNPDLSQGDPFAEEVESVEQGQPEALPLVP
jgi:hypothetical protein